VFVGGKTSGMSCLCIFTDEDLAWRIAMKYPRTVPVAFADELDLVDLLKSFEKSEFDAVVLDTTGAEKWITRVKTIPEFIKCLLRQS
jgi:hypothetical protein